MPWPAAPAAGRSGPRKAIPATCAEPSSASSARSAVSPAVASAPPRPAPDRRPALEPRPGSPSVTTDIIARAPIAPLCAQPSLRAEQVSQLVLGEGAELLETSNDWRRVRTYADAYEGWVHSGYLAEVDRLEAEDWQRDATGWSLGATLQIGDHRV